MRIMTANGRKRGSLEWQQLYAKKFEIKEEFKTKEELLRDPAITERVKKLIRRSSTIAQRTPEWFRMRRDRLTGSAMAAALGECPYTSRKKLMLNKLGLGKKFIGNQATLRGQQLEPHAALAYQKKTGNRLIEYDLGLLCHEKDEYECIAASPDGVTTKGILIEIKCPLRRKIVPGKVPKHYVPQIQALLEIMDLEVGHFVDYRPKGLLPEVCEITAVKRDREWFRLSFPIMRAFVTEMRANRTNGFIEDYKRKVRKIDLGPGFRQDENEKPASLFQFVGEVARVPKYVKPKATLKAKRMEPTESFGFI